MYKIEEVRKIHNSDIKDVSVLDDYIATSSRDGSVKVTNINFSLNIERFPNCGYVNSLKLFKDSILSLFCGCQNGALVFYEDILNNENPIFFLGHNQNICSVDVYNKYVISSSWDCSVKIWDIISHTEVYNLIHEQTVWDSKFISETKFVTVCADKIIRIFEKSSVIQQFSYHVECIRSVFVNEKYIFSVSNAGKVIKSDFFGKILKTKNFKEFVYKISCNKNSFIFSGENGLVAVTDENFKNCFTIKVPSISIWCAVLSDEKIYAAASDGNLYVYSSLRTLNSEKNKISEAEISNRIINEKGGQSTQTGSPSEDKSYKLKDPNYKVVNGQLLNLVDNKWVVVGDVVENPTEKQFDHTFEVEVDGKHLPLSFNKDENVFNVADRFIKNHKLNSNYRDDIVAFINKNFKKNGEYFIYEGLNLEGIQKNICTFEGSEIIIENLKNPSHKNSEVVEEILLKMFGQIQKGQRFVILDCFKFFVAKYYSFDFSFLLDLDIFGQKEALAFTRLLVNLYFEPPFDLEVFHSKIKYFVDNGYIDEKTRDNYEKNRQIRKKK
ncbi:ubiquitin-binding protein [Hamiltosporidium magnivora]|uniref:Ubiquitin-binding protein n=2 Tax=Hamiltosporidium TaxID=1176354 RepID=A0A4Q9LJ06_9MICR|nr:ubiquitin-binding protein [Hamiltosporidium magnivora]